MKAVLTFSLLICVTILAKAQNHPGDDANRSGARSGLAPFYHGVASGDPLDDAVIIWTRLTTTDTTADVKWRVATDTLMSNVIDSGFITTTNDIDYTVKMDVTGLSPNTFYYYEFEYAGQYSLIGRTKTAPLGDVDSLRFAVVSCASYAHGYFNAYDRITERNDVSAVIHLGDYYYEYGDGQYGSARTYQPATEIVNLSDYRMRLSHYHLDASLMRLHQQYPFICTWDDHETANNSWYGGASNHDTGEGDWFNRKAEAIQAYYEWLPVRMPDPAVDTQRIYRKLRYGDLMELHMLDTRLQGRELQGFTNATDPGRTILGQNQFNWLCHNMDTSTAQWQIIGQQVMMAPFKINPLPFGQQYGNDDQWDAYETERTSLYDSVFANNVQNMVILTGDIHTSWANDLPTSTYNSSTGAGSAGVEFVVTSVTSPGLAAAQAVGPTLLQSLNPHMKYIDLAEKGYYILDVNKARVQADWFYVDQVDSLSTVENYGTSWKTDDGTRHLSSASAAAVPNSAQIGAPAPSNPRTPSVPVTNLKDEFRNVLLSIYPNPFNDQITIQYTITKDGPVQMYLFDAMGRTLATEDFGLINKGIHRATFAINNLAPGAYVLVLDINGQKQKRIVVKR
jgi:alkaline phosphatase D